MCLPEVHQKTTTNCSKSMLTLSHSHASNLLYSLLQNSEISSEMIKQLHCLCLVNQTYKEKQMLQLIYRLIHVVHLKDENLSLKFLPQGKYQEFLLSLV